MDFLVVIFASILGSFTQGLTGIGFAVIYISFCNFVLPYLENLSSMKIIITLVTLPVIVKLFKKIKWKYLLVPFVFSFIGNYIAMLILKSVDEVLVKVILGFILVALGAFNLLSKKELHFKGDFLSGSIAGILVGFFSGLCGMAGPVLALYYLGIDELTEDKDCYYATTVTMFEIVGLYQILVYLATDFIPQTTWKYAAVGLVPALIAMIVGQRNFRKFDIGKIKLILFVFMIVMGTFLAISNVIML